MHLSLMQCTLHAYEAMRMLMFGVWVLVFGVWVLVFGVLWGSHSLSEEDVRASVWGFMLHTIQGVSWCVCAEKRNALLKEGFRKSVPNQRDIVFLLRPPTSNPKGSFYSIFCEKIVVVLFGWLFVVALSSCTNNYM